MAETSTQAPPARSIARVQCCVSFRNDSTLTPGVVAISSAWPTNQRSRPATAAPAWNCEEGSSAEACLLSGSSVRCHKPSESLPPGTKWTCV
jgi:hypothetical protein